MQLDDFFPCMATHDKRPSVLRLSAAVSREDQLVVYVVLSKSAVRLEQPPSSVIVEQHAAHSLTSSSFCGWMQASLI